MFYSRMKKAERVYSPNGKPYEKEYSEVVEEDGTVVLKHTGETSTYEKIQEALEETQIYNILNRCVNGDSEALTKVKGFYEDITASPSSLAEAYEKITKMNRDFYNLPNDLREKYPTPQNLIQAIQEGTFEYKEIPKKETIEEIIENNRITEVKEDE